jgi:ABC-type branched-subunit amino acid transport system ATPase component
LQASQVSKRFGGVVAVDRASVDILKGEIVGLMGPNGAGKSTLFNLITGILKPDQGTVSLEDVQINDWPAHRVAAAGVARTFQAPRGFSSMTALENLMVASPERRGETFFGAFGRWKRAEKDIVQRAEEVLDRLGLLEVRDTPYPNLSLGEARLLEIGRHLMRDIKVLLLDEPTSGIPPSRQDALQDLLRDLNAGGVSIVVVEHNLGFLLTLVSTVFVMEKGRVIAKGSPAEVERNEDVIRAYLGRDHVDS